MLEHLIAKTKPQQSLQMHCDLVLGAWATLRDRYEAELPVPTDFWFHSFLSVLLHDFGKISPNFENSLLVALEKPVEDPSLEHIRHEFLSTVFWLFVVADRTKKSTTPYSGRENNPILAVMTHHKSFNSGLFGDYSTEPFRWIVRKHDFEAFISYARQRLQKFGFGNEVSYFTGTETVHARMSSGSLAQLRSMLWKGDNQTNGFVSTALSNASPASRDEYIKYKALLYAADWTASGNRALEQPLCYSAVDLHGWLAARAAARNMEFTGFRLFQQQAGEATGNVLAVAPTGSGKTEAALLWAANRPHDWARIVYLLPTRGTSNALYERLNGYFGSYPTGKNQTERYAAVVHSSAKLYQQETARDNGQTYEPFDYLRESSFFRPVSVATVDQLLTAGFNLGWWELKTFHLFQARVIIDEVHAYEPYTLGLLVSTIRYLREHWQTHFLVMTATLPEQLRELLTEALGGAGQVQRLEDRELLAACRNRFRVEQKPVDGLLPEIRQQVLAGRKVLLVVNTVNEAIRLKNELADLVPLCYHSRFILADRRQKEKMIEQRETAEEWQGKGTLLIATQVVEVSLDIDYDQLYTENAPIDALVQRAGRVNRRRGKLDEAGLPTTEVVVFQHAKASEKVYELENAQHQSILQLTFDTLAQRTASQPYLTEQDLLQLVNDVYAGWKLAEHPSYKKGLGQHQEIQHERCGHLQDYDLAGSDDKEDAVTREGMDTVTVIPMQFRDYLLKIRDRQEQVIKLSLHEVSIRRSLYQVAQRLAKARGKEKDYSKREGYHEFVALPYSAEIGVYLSPADYAEIKAHLKDPDTGQHVCL